MGLLKDVTAFDHLKLTLTLLIKNAAGARVTLQSHL